MLAPSSVMQARSSAALHDFMPEPPSSFATAHRQREGERRTRTHHALHPDPAPVQLHELPTQGQPQPGALHLLRRRPHLAELLKDLLLILGRNADPRVGDRYLH